MKMLTLVICTVFLMAIVTGAAGQVLPTTVVFNALGANSWTVPPNVLQIWVQVWGGGGGGGSGGAQGFGGGGGGGGYAAAAVATTPGETLTATVGAEGGLSVGTSSLK